MIQVKIWTHKADNVGKECMATPDSIQLEVYGNESKTMEIKGVGYHQKGMPSDERRTAKSAKRDYEDHLEILIDAPDLESICNEAIRKGMIRMSQIIPEELLAGLSEANDSILTADVQLNDFLSKVRET